MGLTKSYLVKVSHLEEFFAAIQSAKAPERFTYQFLSYLGFKSSNDRLFSSVLKGLGFLDENGVPLQRYFDFLDQTVSGRILAEAVEEAYEDLFQLRIDAYNLSTDEVKGKLKSLTQGQKSDSVINNMATTFSALCEQADWSVPEVVKKEEPEQPKKEEGEMKSDTTNPEAKISVDLPQISTDRNLELHYNIQLMDIILQPDRHIWHPRMSITCLKYRISLCILPL